jgi:glycosyltransferase involved in cell wall biosynthesis
MADGAGELVLIPGRDPARRAGGSESYATGVMHAAALAGWTPHMFSVAGRGEIVPVSGGVLHRVATPVRPVRSINAELQRRWLVRAIFEHLQDRPGTHVLHAFGAWTGVAVAARDALAERDIPAVVVATSYTPIEHEAAAKRDSPLVRASSRLRWAAAAELAWVRHYTVPREARALRAADVVLVNYESVRVLLTQAYGPGLPIERLTYAAATAFAPLPDAAPTTLALPPGDAPLVLSVSRHDGRKGLDLLIRALALLRDEGVAFRACLLSGGTLLEAHRALVRDLGLGDRVQLPGRVESVGPYLLAADVYVLPSTQEGSGSVAVLEAMQAGATILSAAVDGMPEDITDGEDGVLVEPGSIDALAEGLRRLLENPPLRRGLGLAARAVFERRFSPEVAAAELDAAYARVLARHPAARPTAPSA